MVSKKQIAILLSKLSVFEKPSAKQEQYTTDSEVAAEMLWQAYMLGDIKDKVIADLGCGTGLLGIGCLLLEAKKVYFVDVDKEALKMLDKNLQFVEEEFDMDLKGKVEIMNIDVSKFDKKVDTVVQNPPFGVQKEHADKVFLEKAFEVGQIIYTLHKPESKEFVDKICKNNNCQVTNYCQYSFPLKATMPFHKHKIQRIQVGCWRITKAGDE